MFLTSSSFCLLKHQFYCGAEENVMRLLMQVTVEKNNDIFFAHLNFAQATKGSKNKETAVIRTAHNILYASHNVI